MYVMQSKLTLRMDDELILQAKKTAEQRGKSVSRMVAEFFSSLETPVRDAKEYPPVTGKLLGVMEGHAVDEESYRRHLRDKHL